MSTAVVERLQQLFIEETGDKDFVKAAAAQTATRESLGFAYYLLKALSNPSAGFEKIVKLGPTFNRVGAFKIIQSSSNSVTMEYRSRVREQQRNLCEARMAQLAAMPTIWSVPPAQVEELACQVQGDDACRYRFRWQSPRQLWRWFAGTAAGSLLAMLAASVFGQPWQTTLLLPVCGFLFGAWWDARADVRLRDEQLYSQSTGLEESLQDLTRRHDEVNKINEELARINAELEKRVTDRTHDLQESNQKLAVALEKQKEVDRQKTEFFDNVSHELRTPLTIILLSLEALMQRPSTVVAPGAKEHLVAMERSAARLLRLINNLLDLAKMEAGKRRLAYQPVEIYGFLKALVLPFRIAANDKKIDLVLEGEATTPVQVDAELMDVVFQNLLSNALKFTSQGAVTVRVKESETEVRVEVSDTGQGMAPVDLPLIFNRFAQADSAGVRRFGGTGIGLALVKETVELHGGTIVVASELGRGSTFTVLLPKGQAHIREDLRERRITEVPVRRDRRSSADLLLRRPMGGGAAEGEGDLGPAERALPENAKRVLVVDDDKEIRRYVSAILREEFIVIEASDGREGLEVAQREMPDLIVSDVMMPLLSGLQLTQALRAASETADIPIILLTARQEIEARLSGFDSGADDYVSKPFAPRELLARVEAHLRVREAAARMAQSEKLAVLGLVSSGFAHEVRNPLNGILNALDPLRDMLRVKADTEHTAGTFLSVIEECGTRIHGLAEALLRFARPSAPGELVDVTECLDSTLEVLNWKIPKEVVVKRAYDARERIHGDAAGLNLVFANLIDNAVKSMSAGGVLEVRTLKTERGMEVWVSDTGEGIPDGIRRRMFEPFASGRAAGEGTGLGLALCRRVVLQHRGGIEFESDDGGTTFKVFLPSLDQSSAQASASNPVG